MDTIHTKRICTLMVTHNCNLHCVYCFEKYKSNRPAKRMDVQTAIEILKKEIDLFEQTKQHGDRFAIEFFGGEPLLNFKLIQEVYMWVKAQALSFPIVFQITTNGTLLNEPIRRWLTLHKQDFRIILSVDGDEVMQTQNRGCDINALPIAFVRDTWEKSYFKMTLSRETLHTYAQGVISLTENGYRIASSLAEGITWLDGDEAIYKAQLEEIGKYYLNHPAVEPQHPFNFLYKEVLDTTKTPVKNCGVGTSIATYDIDGKYYPCHLFLPIVHGKDQYEEISTLDFTNPDLLFSEKCKSCPIRFVCRTCYGYNYNDRQNIAERNLTTCKMQLVEVQVISAFEIEYLMQKQSRKKLSDDELLMLKAAVIGYRLVSKLKPNDLSL